MNSNEINLDINVRKAAISYLAIVFEPYIVDPSVITNGKDLTQFLGQDKKITRVNLPLTLEQSNYEFDI
jgi:hypothetical protein